MTFYKRRFLRKRTKLTQNETSRTKTDAFSVFSFVQITSPYATPTSPSCSSSNMQNMTRSNCRRKPLLCSPFSWKTWVQARVFCYLFSVLFVSLIAKHFFLFFFVVDVVVAAGTTGTCSRGEDVNPRLLFFLKNALIFIEVTKKRNNFCKCVCVRGGGGGDLNKFAFFDNLTVPDIKFDKGYFAEHRGFCRCARKREKIMKHDCVERIAHARLYQEISIPGPSIVCVEEVAHKV